MRSFRHAVPFDFRATLPGLAIGLVFTAIGYPLASLFGAAGSLRFLITLTSGAVAAIVTWRLSSTATGSVGSSFLNFLLPAGRSPLGRRSNCHPRRLLERGLFDEAFFAYEAALLEHPQDVDLRAEVAEACYQHERAERAFELFMELRDLPTATRSTSLYASQRVIDVLLGPLADEQRAMVEMRQLIELFPGTREADLARGALTRFKISGRTDDLR